jgi:formyltetrahydrofolate deformylase
MRNNKNRAVLLISCADSDGIIAAVTALLSRLGANILHMDQYVDLDNSMFFMRVEWDLEKFSINCSDFETIFRHEVAKRYSMDWNIYLSEKKQKMAIFVSKYGHCFFDLLSSWRNGDLNVDIPLIISNHEDFREDAERYNIPFVHLPINKDNREEMAIKQLELLKENNIDFAVLARYMQIIPESIIDNYSNKIINIHHSFLPSFPGAKPYHQAFDKGVKITGATAHFVTSKLDQGPIIEQDIQRVNNKFSVDELIRTGQDVEKRVLTSAVISHIERKILVYNNRTVVFS